MPCCKDFLKKYDKRWKGELPEKKGDERNAKASKNKEKEKERNLVQKKIEETFKKLKGGRKFWKKRTRRKEKENSKKSQKQRRGKKQKQLKEKWLTLSWITTIIDLNSDDWDYSSIKRKPGCF